MMNRISLTLLLSAFVSTAFAGVIIGGTRIIYDASKNETILNIKNPDKQPYLIQSWIDSNGIDDNLKNTSKAPFIVTPPLFRLDSNAENILRIIPKNYNFPADKESVYWMNVKSIPTIDESKKNVLQFTFKTRVKFFYRPTLVSKLRPEDYYGKLNFKSTGHALSVSNPSPFFMTFHMLSINGIKVNTSSSMVPPFENIALQVPNVGHGQKVTWQMINDYGGSSKKYEQLIN